MMMDLDERLIGRNERLLRDLRPRVVYTDLDGTMLGRNGSLVHDDTGVATRAPAEALLAAHEAGIELVPSSGRTIRGLVGDARLLGLSTVIGEMGAVIAYRFGHELVHNLGAYPGGDAMPADAMESSGAVKALLERYRGRLEFHAPWHALRDYTQLFRGLVDVEEAGAFLAAEGHDWLQLTDNGILRGAYLGLPSGSAHVYHLVPAGVTKASAVATDRARRAIARAETVAIGDSLADLEMAAEVGWMILTRDAADKDPRLLVAAERYDNVLVTDEPGNRGWAQAIALLSIERAVT